MINALGAGLVDDSRSVHEFLLRCSLVSAFDRCVNLLNRGLDTCTDRLVPVGVSLTYQNSFLS